jgi:hypothetical protein
MKDDSDDSVVRAYMQELAAGPVAELPDARSIWWRAQMRERFAARERAVRPIRLIETLTGLLCAAAALALLIVGRDSVAAVLEAVSRSPLAPLAAVAFAMTLGAAAFLIRVVLSEE